MTDWSWVHNSRAVMLTTFRRSGEGVGTPVGFAVDGERLYFMTDPASGKVKRIRHTPRVTIAPCTLPGKVTGPEKSAAAAPIEGAEAERAMKMITSRNRVAWFFILRKDKKQGRTRQLFAVTLVS